MNPIATIADMIRAAETHADDLSADRIRAIEYYQGDMTDTPADDGRSRMVSRDVRAHIKKVLPSMMRTIFASGDVVEYQPVGPGDEEGAEQASDYVNRVVAPEADIRRHVEDAIHDALLLRNGILKWWWSEKKSVSVSEHSGLDDDAFAQLVNDEDTEVLEHTERQDVMETPEGPMPMTVHDVRIKRYDTEKCIKVAAVPRERFLIHPDAVTLEDSLLTGEIMKLTRSDLVAMGYDQKTVDGLSMAHEDDYEQGLRRDFVDESDESHGPNEQIDYYDVFVRFDMDGDGIAELRHMCFAGGLHERNLLMDEECDEVQFCDIKIMAQPHQWEGISLADDLMDLQRAKTVLMRQTLDNIYWQNNPQPIMQAGAIENEEAVFNPEFGLPIRVKAGMSTGDAIGFNTVPFVAKDSFAMMEYLDQEAVDRTGVSDASAGLAPDALQNMTAKASAMIEQQGIGQTEMMVRTVAEGLRRFFRGILRLTIRHQDVERTVRLRGEWVQFDPRHWNSGMDCTVNVGLGSGTRERDMQMMQMIMGLQEKMLAGFGPDNPFVKPENLWAALSKMVETAGLKTPETYFTEPDPQEVQQKLQAASQQGQAGEMAKAQADQAKMQMEAQAKQAEMAMRREEMQAEMALKREQKEAEMQLARERMEAEFALARDKMQMEAAINRSMGEASGLNSGVRMGGAVG